MIEELYEKLCTIPSDINEHLPKLRELAERTDVVVEVGRRKGASTIALLSAGPVHLISVDVVRDDEVIDMVTALAEEQGTQFEFIESCSLAVTIPECDMLFIDSLHTAEHLRGELETHVECVLPGGCIVLHDTTTYRDCGEDPDSAGNGLGKVIEDFLAGNPEWSKTYEATNNNGLTVLSRANN